MDPAPYTNITAMTSENCVELDAEPSNGLGPAVADVTQAELGAPFVAQAVPFVCLTFTLS